MLKLLSAGSWPKVASHFDALGDGFGHKVVSGEAISQRPLLSTQKRHRQRPWVCPDYISVCSASSNASSTSIPRYLTVLSIFL
jgi:hypothetical protein